MLEHLKREANLGRTENGAATYLSTTSDCLDFFAVMGGLRAAREEEILARFYRAYGEDPDLAMKLLFFARDIRGGLGERRLFRLILRDLARTHRDSVKKNLAAVPEMGRWDDLLVLLDTPCRAEVLALVAGQLRADLAARRAGGSVSLLAKWLPSVNASSPETRALAGSLARGLRLSHRRYRLLCTALRRELDLLENRMRRGDYTFDYSKQPSQALLRHRAAFWRWDGPRYWAWLEDAAAGRAAMHTAALTPYDVIAPFYGINPPDPGAVRSLDAAWRALPDFTRGENALVVADGSGSMYTGRNPCPAAVAQSLAIYFAERNRGPFRDHFITFSTRPRLVEIKGRDIGEKVRYCRSFNEIANTDLQRVFDLLLHTALVHRVPQGELPATLYIISDMEFDVCAKGAALTNFAAARAAWAQAGYALPRVVFWNVAARGANQPVTKNEQGVALVSGASPRVFSLIREGNLEPWAFMAQCLADPRYTSIHA